MLIYVMFVFPTLPKPNSEWFVPIFLSAPLIFCNLQSRCGSFLILVRLESRTKLDTFLLVTVICQRKQGHIPVPQTVYVLVSENMSNFGCRERTVFLVNLSKTFFETFRLPDLEVQVDCRFKKYCLLIDGCIQMLHKENELYMAINIDNILIPDSFT